MTYRPWIEDPDDDPLWTDAEIERFAKAVAAERRVLRFPDLRVRLDGPQDNIIIFPVVRGKRRR